jgi:transposase
VDTYSLGREKGVQMAKRGSRARRSYPQAYRDRILDLVRSGRAPEELAKEFEPTAQTIRNWMKQAGVDGDDTPGGVAGDTVLELERLRRENEQLRLEREILKKAAAWFARETDAVPPRSSHS